MPAAGAVPRQAPAGSLPPTTLPAGLLAAFRILAALAVTLALLPVAIALRLAGGSVDRRLAAVWSRLLLRILGLAVHREGIPAAGGLLAANHASWLDPLVIGAAAPAFFVAKREVRSWPGIGWICRLGRVEFVERRPSAARGQVDRLALRLARGHLLCVFPEGTSTDGLRVLRFRSSLFAALFAPPPAGGRPADRRPATVQPVAIRYQPDRALPAEFYGWWGDRTFAGHLREVLLHSRRGRVTIAFLTPVAAAECGDRKALAARVEAAVRRRFDADGDAG